MIVRLKPQQRKQLQELLPQELKEEFAKGLARYSVSYRGWEEKGFSVGDKKKLKEMLTEVKALMKDSKNTERYAPMVKYADANSGKFKGIFNSNTVLTWGISRHDELCQNDCRGHQKGIQRDQTWTCN